MQSVTGMSPTFICERDGFFAPGSGEICANQRSTLASMPPPCPGPK